MPYKDPEKRKSYAKEKSATYYEKNKELVKVASATRSRKFRADWAAFKTTLVCSVCGFAHPAAMDFHHPPGTKTHGVHKLAQSASAKLLQIEIAKCIVLCANCHRIHHHDEKIAGRKKRKKAINRAP